ncbi:lactate dehydrogenase [Streptomyces sp. NPDC090085]|uniref:lactate/malate family dehydrogenase n=1 Tax=Streptomyces sp. NPDC090085 TaxID=3365943 RepID=UPI00382EF41D
MKPPIGAVGIVGAGAVGQTVGTLLVAAGWCAEVCVTSGTEESAAGLVTDLQDMAEVTGSPVRAVRAPLAGMGACDAVVICPRAKFSNARTSDVRMAGLAANAPLLASIGQALNGYAGVAAVVTNPVDVMARIFAERSGACRVYGIGSSTDSARYRLSLADRLGVAPSAVQGQVIGEHGDAAVVCAAATRVHGQPVPVPVDQVRRDFADRPRQITAGIGRARSGPAGAVLAVLTAALGITDSVVEVSVSHGGGWYGIPLRFTAGVPTLAVPGLAPDERRALAAASSKLAAAYRAAVHPNEGDPLP